MKALKFNGTKITNETKNTIDKVELKFNHSNLKYNDHNCTRMPLS